jgi:hypothetical protein
MTMGTNDPRRPDEASGDPLDALLGNLQGDTGAPVDEKADLGALLGGLTGSGQSTGSEADLGALLSGMLGSGGAQGGEADLGALLGSLLGGSGSAAGSGEADLGALLGGLGGAGTATPSGGADLSALLGSLLGGGASQEPGSPDDFMSAALGGGQSGGGLLGSLLGGLLGGGSSMSGGVTGSGGVSGALIQAAMGFLLHALANPQHSGVDASDVMTRLGNDTLDTDYVRQSGLAAQFSQEANVDEDTAAETLTVALHALGGRTG